MAHTGEILNPQVLYDGQALPIGSTLPTGINFSFRFQGKNTSVVSLELAAWWVIFDPTGAARESNSTTVGVAGPGVSYSISGLPINLNIPGNWTVWAILYGKLSGETAWTQLDEFPYGTLLVVGVAGVQYAGHIAYRSILYDDKEVGFASTIEKNKSLTVRIVGLNDMASVQAMAVRWVVKNPSGAIVLSQTGDWINVNPGYAIQQDITPITLNVEGYWSIKVELLMGEVAHTVVDTYDGPLCTCIPAQQQQYTGEILDVWVNKVPEGNKLPIPVSVDAEGHSFEVFVDFKNTSQYDYYASCKITVVDPDGHISTPPLDRASITAGQTLLNWGVFALPNVTKAGIWTILVEFLLDNGTLITSLGPTTCLNAVGWIGRITSMWFNKGSQVRAPFMTPVIADGQNFEIGVSYINDSARTVIAGVRVDVWDPDGIKQPTPTVDYTGIAPGEELSVEYQFGAVDKAGEWEIKLTFVERDDQLIITEWPLTGNGVLFNTQPLAEFSDLQILSYTRNVFEGEAAAQSIDVSPGDIITVNVGFTYTTPSPLKVQLSGSLWIPPGVDYTIPAEIDLDTGVDQTWEGGIQIPIEDEIGLKNDTYHLLVSLPNYGLSAQVDNAIKCVGMTEDFGFNVIGEMVGMLVLVMVVMMMMNMMQGFTGEISAPKPASWGESAAGWAREKGAQAGQWVQERISPVEIHIHDED